MKFFKHESQLNLKKQLSIMTAFYHQYDIINLINLIWKILRNPDEVNTQAERDIKVILNQHYFPVNHQQATQFCLQIKQNVNMCEIHFNLAKAMIIDTLYQVILCFDLKKNHLTSQFQIIQFHIFCYHQYYNFIHKSHDNKPSNTPRITMTTAAYLLNLIHIRGISDINFPSLSKQQTEYITNIESNLENKKPLNHITANLDVSKI